MKYFFFILVISLLVAINARKVQRCFPVTKPPAAQCPKGEEFLENGPGPFCYQTCCGPRGPPCRMDSFTSGCFCQEGFIKMFPVANNTGADLNNPCVQECDFKMCFASPCPGANEEYRDCGPTNTCDNQVCRGMRPICTEEDAAVCIAGCFCQAGYSRDGGICVKECPLYP